MSAFPAHRPCKSTEPHSIAEDDWMLMLSVLWIASHFHGVQCDSFVGIE